MSRYMIVDGSGSGHCCFDATIVDTNRKHPHYEQGHWLCECFDLQDAELITETLNRYEKLRKLNPRQFAELYEANLKTGKPFDELVDGLE